MPVGPPCAAFPPQSRRHCSCLVGRSPWRSPKRDTARMAASTQGDRKFARRCRNISCKAGFALFRRNATAKSSGCGGGWIDHLLYSGDFGCRKTANFGVPADDCLVFGKIHAEGFIIGNITLDPLDVGAKLTQHIVRFRCAAWRSCSHSKVPTFGISRSMMNFCKAMTLSLNRALLISRHQKVPLPILDQP
jgi:hypothetical protein